MNSVSIIVVNYNAGSILTDCVGLGLKQVAEVIVVDNASSDESLYMLESSFGDNSRLSIIRNSQNMGFAAACNVGFKVATGDYLFFLNPDCLLQKDTVLKLIKGFEVSPYVGMVGGLLINPDGTEQAGGRRAVPTPWRSFVRAFGLFRYAKRWPVLFSDFNLHKQRLPVVSIEVEAISGACMLVKRVAMKDVGFWDDSYFLHCEDLDLCMRFRQKRWKIVFAPDAPVIHYLGMCSTSRPIFVEWHKHNGMMRFYRKFFRHQYPGALMWLVTLGVWIRFVCVTGYYTQLCLFRCLGFGSGK